MRAVVKLTSIFLLAAIGNLFLFSCCEKEKQSILKAALQQTGRNRAELEEIILIWNKILFMRNNQFNF